MAHRAGSAARASRIEEGLFARIPLSEILQGQGFDDRPAAVRARGGFPKGDGRSVIWRIGGGA